MPGMERLEAKEINGRTYYYYSKWAWVNGRCRRVWQKYLGKLEDIAKAVEGGGPAALYAEVFEWALPLAVWQECARAQVVQEVDKLCPKREQGLSTGQYLAIAAANRAMAPKSKRSMWQWFSGTVLLRQVPQASKAALSSQRFWDHMDRVDADKATVIWKSILEGVVAREGIDVSAVCYDGTNFYTFIDTFNARCRIAKRGKNKQGRSNLRQVSYCLFCAADGQIPLFYDVYEGNRHDAKEFPLVLQRFHEFLNELRGQDAPLPCTTVVFDKGNNSADNFAILDALGVSYVGSVKLDEHKELAAVRNGDAAFVACCGDALEGTKAFRVTRDVYGRKRVLVVTYNQALFNAQWQTVQTDVTRALDKLSCLQQRLQDRADGILTQGKPPTIESVQSQCKAILSRQHMKRVITVTVTQDRSSSLPKLAYTVDADALSALADTYLGKNLLVTNREQWTNEQIVEAYRSQFIIEDVFKAMKDRSTGSWWPLHHWTDSKIHVHALYCTIALLLRAVLLRRVRQAGLPLSAKRLLSELHAVREVVNLYPRKRRDRDERRQTVLTRTSDMQQRILSVLQLPSVGSGPAGVLG